MYGFMSRFLISVSICFTFVLLFFFTHESLKIHENMKLEIVKGQHFYNYSAASLHNPYH